jgi:hypothetical protein
VAGFWRTTSTWQARKRARIDGGVTPHDGDHSNVNSPRLFTKADESRLWTIGNSLRAKELLPLRKRCASRLIIEAN